jgi:hypothetical protein
MQEYWIALIISSLSLGVSVARLLPVKEWLHYWFSRLWPQSDQNDVRHPANLESTLASLQQRVEQLEAICLVERVKTLDPSAPSGSGGGRAAQHAVTRGTGEDGKAQGMKVNRSRLFGDEIS